MRTFNFVEPVKKTVLAQSTGCTLENTRLRIKCRFITWPKWPKVTPADGLVLDLSQKDDHLLVYCTPPSLLEWTESWRLVSPFSHKPVCLVFSIVSFSRYAIVDKQKNHDLIAFKPGELDGKGHNHSAKLKKRLADFTVFSFSWYIYILPRCV